MTSWKLMLEYLNKIYQHNLFTAQKRQQKSRNRLFTELINTTLLTYGNKILGTYDGWANNWIPFKYIATGSDRRTTLKIYNYNKRYRVRFLPLKKFSWHVNPGFPMSIIEGKDTLS
jgi:hypothetical protein